jgi:hypothetical protein
MGLAAPDCGMVVVAVIPSIPEAGICCDAPPIPPIPSLGSFLALVVGLSSGFVAVGLSVNCGETPWMGNGKLGEGGLVTCRCWDWNSMAYHPPIPAIATPPANHQPHFEKLIFSIGFICVALPVRNVICTIVYTIDYLVWIEMTVLFSKALS